LKNKDIFKIMLTWIISLFIFASLAHSATVGKISGVVKDKETGEPLPGVSIQIAGTQMGAATNPKGEYFIINVPPDKYTVKASLIGYAPMEVQNVDVLVDLTTFLDFSLVSQAIELGKGITVVAERPLLIKDQTSSLRVMEDEEIKNMPTRGYQQAVSLQTGITPYSDNPATRLRGDRENTNTPTLNIRGGRASEVAYYVDGFSQQDYLTGMATTDINQNAIQEIAVTTGGFNAEYGRIMSGAINVVTKEGGSEYTGNLEAVTDNLNTESKRYDYNLYDVAFSGPIIPGNDRTSFFVSGERRWQGDRSPSAIGGGILKHNELGGWTWQGKFGFKLTNAFDLKFGTLGSIDDWREYNHAYKFDFEHMPRYLDKNYSYYGKITHNVNPSLFYTLSANYFSTERKRGDGVYFDNLLAYGRPDGNPRYDQEALFWSWDDKQYYVVGNDTFGIPTPNVDTVWYPHIMNGGQPTPFMHQTDTTGDEGHVWDDYLHRESAYYGVNLDVTAQVNPYNQLRSGFEFQRHTLRYYNHLFPIRIWDGETIESGGFDDINNFGYNLFGEKSDTSISFMSVSEGGKDTTYYRMDGAKHPITLAFYLQDKFEWKWLVVNAGIRWDYLDVRSKRLKDEVLPFGLDADSNKQSQFGPEDFEESKPFQQISPRLGIGFPVTDKTVLHFSYGKFFQQPDLQNLYVSYRYMQYKVQKGGYYFAFGNPNLKPEETTAYELGLTHQLAPDLKFDLTAYYKDVENLTEVINQPSFPRAYASFRNRDYGTIKGVEFAVTKRRTNYIGFNLNYTLSLAKGTGSYANTQRNIAWAVGATVVPPKMTAPLDFDQRHKITAILDIRAGKGRGLMIGDIRPFEEAGINLVFNAGSGHPYTPMKTANEVTLGNLAPSPDGPINSRYGPWTYRFDLKANKTITFGRLSWDIYIWVLNLLDRKNALVVYESSGLPDATGWDSTPEGQALINDSRYSNPHDASDLTAEEKLSLREHDPTNFDTPRQIRLGIKFNF
jgi:outer membrane receptor protein involved in Fe transport